jgi:hypothetical protein
MKDNGMPMLTEVPRIGSEYIKLRSGELVKWQNFDEKTQTFEIKSSEGETIKVHRRDTEIPTSNEELDFLLSKPK